MDETTFRTEVLLTMRRAGIRPELIHAYVQTGLILTTENRKYLSSRDRKAWDRAIEDYFECVGEDDRDGQ
jgi:hypothetical protein